MTYLGLIIYFGICYIIADKIGRNKKIGFTKSLFLCLLLPFIGFLITLGGAQLNAKGCKWCGNADNEAEFCGLCGKNENGDISTHFKK